MRPLRVEIEAFGSFADHQRVDFEALGPNRLFLIHGPTGAGKSTILEAICFALYGASASAESSVSHLRSQHAEAQRLTRVVLWFQLGEDRYRVERTPRQSRPKKRGVGFIEERGTAALYRLKAGESEEAPGEPLATKQGDVDREVQRLLGLDRAQFRQVILLPQGEFRKLLEATSQERQQILTQLFDIDRYADLERGLKTAADSLRSTLGHLEERRATLLGQAEAENEEAFGLRRKALAVELEGARKALGEIEAREQTARSALEKAKTDRQKRADRAQAEQAFQALDARRPEFENARTRLREAVRAEPVALRLEALREARREAAEIEAQARAAATALTESVDRLGAARNEEFAAREREPELRGLDERMHGLQAARVAAERLAALRQEHAEQLATRKTEAARLETAAERFAGATEGLAVLEAQADAMPALVAAQQGRTERRAVDAARLDRARRSAALEGRLGALAERRAGLEGTLAEARARVAGVESELEAGRRAEREAAASRLAASLVDGEACPVCGATEHPCAATPGGADAGQGGAAGAAAEALEALEQRSARIRAELEAPLASLAALDGELSSEQRALAALREEAPPTEEAGATVAELEGELAEADRAIAAGAETLEAAGRAQAALLERRQEIASLREAVDGLRLAVESGRAADEERAGAIAEQEAALPVEARTPKALEDALAETAERRTALATRIETTARAVAEAEQARAGHVATQTALTSAVERVASRVQGAQQAVDEALRAAGFESEAAVHAARIEPDARTELEGRVEGFDRDLESARRQREQTIAAAAEAVEADVEALATGLAASVEARDTRREEVSAMQERVAQWDRLGDALDRLRSESGELLSRYERIGALSNVASGDNPERVSFQRFVLAAFLDEVLALATVSLRRMSKGRYALQRVSEQVDRRRRAGLDLAVWDAHTGQERPVTTLSGGESFCAALALALGLAEVVQRHSGGTRLDAIFVDEGFGSLDPESLDLALATLVELQSGGRLVGLISHVAELKERIDTRIEVRPGRGGSSLALTLP